MFFQKAQIVEDSDFCPEDSVTPISNATRVAKVKVKVKKPFYKKWWVWTIAGVTVAIAVVAFFSYRKDNQLYKKLLDSIL